MYPEEANGFASSGIWNSFTFATCGLGNGYELAASLDGPHGPHRPNFLSALKKVFLVTDWFTGAHDPGGVDFGHKKH